MLLLINFCDRDAEHRHNPKLTVRPRIKSCQLVVDTKSHSLLWLGYRDDDSDLSKNATFLLQYYSFAFLIEAMLFFSRETMFCNQSVINGKNRDKTLLNSMA